jgi:hypothetical protein
MIFAIQEKTSHFAALSEIRVDEVREKWSTNKLEKANEMQLKMMSGKRKLSQIICRGVETFTNWAHSTLTN